MPAAPRVAAAMTAVAACLVPVVASPATPAAGATCQAPNVSLLTHAPRLTALPKGATMKVWDTGPESPSIRSLRIVEVVVPKSSALGLHVWTTGALTRSNQTSKVLAGHTAGVVATNGDVFDATRGSLPLGESILGGRVAKARVYPHPNPVTIISSTGKSMPAAIQLVGHVTAAGRIVHINAVNWQSVLSGGINVYAAPWGSGRRPYGDVDVVVSGGVVRALRYGTSRGQPPKTGQQILTATGTQASFLRSLHVGQSVKIWYSFTSRLAPWPVSQAIEHGAPFVLDGARTWYGCDSRSEQIRPRTAIAWNKAGDLLLITVSGRAVFSGTMFGGSTMHNMSYYTKLLGAYNAFPMDGGGSTTMVVRKHLPGTPARVDRYTSYQRAVPNFLGVA